MFARGVSVPGGVRLFPPAARPCFVSRPVWWRGAGGWGGSAPVRFINVRLVPDCIKNMPLCVCVCEGAQLCVCVRRHV